MPPIAIYPAVLYRGGEITSDDDLLAVVRAIPAQARAAEQRIDAERAAREARERDLLTDALSEAWPRLQRGRETAQLVAHGRDGHGDHRVYVLHSDVRDARSARRRKTEPSTSFRGLYIVSADGQLLPPSRTRAKPGEFALVKRTFSSPPPRSLQITHRGSTTVVALPKPTLRPVARDDRAHDRRQRARTAPP